MHNELQHFNISYAAIALGLTIKLIPDINRGVIGQQPKT